LDPQKVMWIFNLTSLDPQKVMDFQPNLTGPSNFGPSNFGPSKVISLWDLAVNVSYFCWQIPKFFATRQNKIQLICVTSVGKFQIALCATECFCSQSKKFRCAAEQNTVIQFLFATQKFSLRACVDKFQNSSLYARTDTVLLFFMVNAKISRNSKNFLRGWTKCS
jgi:hypothetical protein